MDCSNQFQRTDKSITWEQAIQKNENLNTIALLTIHINYYIKGVLNVFQGGDLEIKDQFSFDMPAIKSDKDWLKLVNELISNAEKLIEHIEIMDDNLLTQ